MNTEPEGIVVAIFMFEISMMFPTTLQAAGVKLIRQETAPLVKVDGVVS